MNAKFLILIIGLMLVSCSSSKKDVKPVIKDKGIKNELNLLIEKMQTEEAYIFSPNQFSKAKECHEEFKNNEHQDIQKVISSYQTALKNINKLKDEVPKLVKARIDSIKFGGKKEIKEFEEAEEELKEITSEYEESGEFDREDAEQLEKKYRKIELDLIKEKFLGRAKRRLLECEQLGGNELTPKTIKEAKVYLNEVNEFIERDRYNDEEITPKAKEALFMAERAQNILINVKKMKQETNEDTILRFERMLLNISKKLEIKDQRNHSFVEQEEEINNYITSLFKAGQSIYSEKTKIKSELKEVKEVATELSKKEKIRQLMDSVQKEFNLTEAEVYQQDERVIIRLTGLKFSSGTYDIGEDYEAILYRVGDVIKKLGKTVVIVEGHTDSVGISEQNHELSKKRAESVREFLMNKSYLLNELSTSEGYGDTRPIASNKTKEGRAQNRRVDLIITPLEF